MTKNTLKVAFTVALALICLTAFAGCTIVVDGIDVTDYTGVQFTTYDYFNTNTTVSCYLPADRKEELEALWNGEIKSALDKISTLLSSDGENSDINAFNEAEAGATIRIEGLTYEVLALAKKAYEDTDGAFNPALALSVDLWGFSARFNEKDYAPEKPYDRENYRSELPDEKYVQAFLSLSDFSDTEIGEDSKGYYIKKSDSSEIVDGVTYTQQIDLSGIGKGYCADIIAEILRNNGFGFGFVDIGASSMSLMKNARKDACAELGEWTVSVLSPTESGKYYFKAYLKDVSLATSGSYQQYYEVGGKRYSHILDPETGMPYEGEVLTVSVYGENAALCDAYSTAMCVLGKDRALKLASELEAYTYTMAVKSGAGFETITDANGKITG